MLHALLCTSQVISARTYEPTASVELFFREADIPREFEVMGKISIYNFDGAQKQLEKWQRKKGADGILFEKPNRNPVTRFDKNEINNAAILSVTNEPDSYIKAYFIKYR